MILVFLHLLAHALWVRRANSSSNKQSARQKEAERPIRPLPDVLVWPSLPLLALKFFATGLTKSSVSTLTSPQLAAAAAAANANATAHDDPDGATNASADCASLRALAIIVLAVLAFFLLTSAFLLARFYAFLIKEQAWRAAERPASPTEVQGTLAQTRS